MSAKKDKASQTPTVVRFKESTKEALYKRAFTEDRSISYLVEKAVRKDLGLER